MPTVLKAKEEERSDFMSWGKKAKICMMNFIRIKMPHHLRQNNKCS